VGGAGLAVAVSAPAGAWAFGDPSRWRLATLLCVVPALAIAVLALRLGPHEPVTGSTGAGDTPFGWRDLLRARNAFFVAAYASFGIAYIAYATFAVAGFAARGVPPAVVTAAWSALGLAAVAGALCVAPVLAGRAARYSFVFPLAAGAVGCWISSRPGVASPVAGAICVGFGLAASPTVASAFCAPAQRRGDVRGRVHRGDDGLRHRSARGAARGGTRRRSHGAWAVPLFAAIVFACGTFCAAVDARLARA